MRVTLKMLFLIWNLYCVGNVKLKICFGLLNKYRQIIVVELNDSLIFLIEKSVNGNQVILSYFRLDKVTRNFSLSHAQRSGCSKRVFKREHGPGVCSVVLHGADGCCTKIPFLAVEFNFGHSIKYLNVQ